MINKRYAMTSFLVLVALLLHASPAPAEVNEESDAEQPVRTQSADTLSNFDHWFVLKMQGRRVGHAHIQREHQGDRITSTQAMNLAIKRGAATIRVQQSSRFVETADHEPVEATSQIDMARRAIKQHLTFNEDGRTLVTTQGGRTQKRQLPPIEKDWLTPLQADRKARRKLANDAERIEVRTLDLSASHNPITVMMKVKGDRDVQVMGKTVPAVAWDATISAMPGRTMRQYVDRQTRLVKADIPLMPGLKVTMLRADKELATGRVNPPEIMASLLIQPDQPIDRPRQLKKATYKLRIKEGRQIDRRKQLPSSPAQRVEWLNDNTARLTVNTAAKPTGKAAPPGAKYTAASTMLDHADPQVEQLVDEALGERRDTLSDREKAKRLRDFVRDYITEKDLSVGLATASEVAGSAQGDCTEHAMLLAAMLRACDMPSRTANGLVYVERFVGKRHVFGYHMWTQAWLPAKAGTDGEGPRWVDLDAALPGHAMGFDATHIALSHNALTGPGVSNQLVKMAPLVGRLQVKVVETTHRGNESRPERETQSQDTRGNANSRTIRDSMRDIITQ